MNNQFNRPKCKCKDCGKTFLKGDEGDNEEFCLRCEHISMRERQDSFEEVEIDEAYPASDDIWDEGYF